MATLSLMTFEDFEAQVRAQTGATNYSDPQTTLLMRWTNVLINKIYLLTRFIDGAWGRDTTTLTNLNTTGVYHAPSDGGSYTTATKTFASLTGLGQTYVGGWVFFVDGTNSRGFYGLIDHVNTAGTSCVLRLVVGTGAAADIASANLQAIFKPNPVFYGGANLNSVSPYNIVKIVDSSLGNMVRLDGNVFASPGVNYKNMPYTEFAGDAVYVSKGASCGAYGTWTMWYDEKPDTITAVSDTIDLRPEHIPILTDELSRWVLNYMTNVLGRKDVTMPSGESALILQLQNRFKKHTEEMMIRRKKMESK